MKARLVVQLGLLIPFVAYGQTSAPPSPGDVVRQFFKAEQDGHWLDAARHLDLDAFEAYREDAVRSFAQRRGRIGPTPEQVMARDSSIPRPVAEYIAKQYSAMADSDELSREFARTVSVDTLRLLPSDQAAARWLEARDPRWQFERSIAHLAPDCQKSPSGSIPTEAPKDVLEPAVTPSGRASDTTAYVVFVERRGNPSGRVYRGQASGIITLKRIANEWRIVPLPDLGFAGGVRNYLALGCTKVGVQTSK